MLYSQRLLKWLLAFPNPFEMHKKTPPTKADLLKENKAIVSRILPDGDETKPVKGVEFRADFSTKDAAMNARAHLLDIFADFPDKQVYVMTNTERAPIAEINLNLDMVVTASSLTDIEWEFNKCVLSLGGWGSGWVFEN